MQKGVNKIVVISLAGTLLCGALSAAPAAMASAAPVEQSAKKNTPKKKTADKKPAANNKKSTPKSKTAAPAKRTINTAQKEKQDAQARITEATRKLNDNARQTEKKLTELNMIRGEIDRTEAQIQRTRQQVDSINAHITHTQDSLTSLDTRLNNLKTSYISALRKLQGSQIMTNELAYIFSSGSFQKAKARIRYVQEFGRWRRRKAEEIKQTQQTILAKKEQLTKLQSERAASLDLLSADQASLVSRREEADRTVTQLKTDEAGLKRAIENEKKRLTNIDREITRMIEAERKERERREAERKRKAEEAEARRKKAAADKAAKESKPSQKSGKDTPKSSTPAKDTKPAAKPAAPTKPKQALDTSDPDAEMTAKFAEAQGKMQFPVAGAYRIAHKYGAQPGQPNNTGIEIVLDSGDTARSVFEGTVSRIFQNSDGNYAIMVRHGAYITVFYNIASPSVKTGQTVTAGQTIGRVATDDRYSRPMLHFEVRKGSSTMNPLQWVK